jgi:hypothetical protein
MADAAAHEEKDDRPGARRGRGRIRLGEHGAERETEEAATGLEKEAAAIDAIAGVEGRCPIK